MAVEDDSGDHVTVTCRTTIRITGVPSGPAVPSRSNLASPQQPSVFKR